MPIPREGQRELVQEIVNLLDEKQSGIHASELSCILPLKNTPPDPVLSIASQDKRLKIAQGGYLYLADWGSSRRETICQALSAVLEAAARPLALGEIASLVESRIGRPIGMPLISCALQAIEADSNSATREWSLSRPSTDDDEDTANLSDDTSLRHHPISVKANRKPVRVRVSERQCVRAATTTARTSVVPIAARSQREATRTTA